MVIVLYFPVTDLIARHDVGTITGAKRAPALEAARDAARGRLITTLAGVFAAGALWFTARNYLLARQGQVTDRYTKAVEQLGSEKMDVRIGAIYALERIARDSRTDQPTVMQVLAAFIRGHSREPWPPSGSEGTETEGPERTTRPDVQAAVTVIGRRHTQHDRQPIDLARVDLTGADLTDVHLQHVNLTSADLTLAILTGADLTDAQLSGAVLPRAHLTRADLTDARLDGANLTAAYLIGADLTRADLSANLTDARLQHANLTGANLTGANLTAANLTDANLTSATFEDADFDGALWPLDWRVPDGWTPAKSGRLQRNPG